MIWLAACGAPVQRPNLRPTIETETKMADTDVSMGVHTSGNETTDVEVDESALDLKLTLLEHNLQNLRVEAVERELLVARNEWRRSVLVSCSILVLVVLLPLFSIRNVPQVSLMLIDSILSGLLVMGVMWAFNCLLTVRHQSLVRDAVTEVYREGNSLLNFARTFLKKPGFGGERGNASR